MIDFIGKRYWFFLISAIIIVIGIASLAILGLKLGVDFKSGTAMTLHFDKDVELSQLRDEFAGLGYDKAVIQPAGKGDFVVRLRDLSSEENKKLIDDLKTKLNIEITVSNLYTVSPVVAEGTVRNTTIAILVVAACILLYLSFAFRRMPRPFRWGTCAVVALCHDLLIVIAVFSILGWIAGVEIDSLFVTGVLSVVGISANNIVVVFDRIRANLNRGISKDFDFTVNVGIVESVGRSLNTGLATLFVLLALYLFGGITIRSLVLVLIVGIATGIYSSLCIGGQLLVAWDKNDLRKLFSRRRESESNA